MIRRSDQEADTGKGSRCGHIGHGGMVRGTALLPTPPKVHDSPRAAAAREAKVPVSLRFESRL